VREHEAKLYRFVPYDRFGMAAFGLLDKYVSAAAIERERASASGAGYSYTLRCGGVFGFASVRRPIGILVNGEEAPFAKIEDASAASFYRIPCASGDEDQASVEIEIVFA